MSKQSIREPLPMFFDANGNALDNGYIYIGTENLNPEANPIAVYWDSALKYPAAQPIRTTFGYPSRDGAPARLYTNSHYSILVKDSNSNQIYSVESDTQFLQTDSISYNISQTGSVDQTINAKLREWVSIFDFGAVGDGSTCDSAAVTACANYCRTSLKGMFCPAGYIIKITSAIDLTSIRNIDFRSNILVPKALHDVSIGVTVGKMANDRGFDWHFQNIYSDCSNAAIGPTPSKPLIRVWGTKSGVIRMSDCPYVQFYADEPTGVSTNGNVYNRIYFDGAIWFLELTGNTGISPNNENTFHGGRITNLTVDGKNYGHNHNFFVMNTFESADPIFPAILFDGTASMNKILRGRFEGASSGTTVTFGASTYGNYVERTWSGVGNPREQFAIGTITVSDSGVGNLVTSDGATYFDKIPLFDVDHNSGIIANGASSSAADPRISPVNGGIDDFSDVVLTPGLQGFEVNRRFAYAALTEPIAVSLGDCISFEGDFDGTTVRTAIFALDSDMKPILTADGGHKYIEQPGATQNTTYGKYSQGANQTAVTINSSAACVARSEVKYVRVGFYTGVSGSKYRRFSAYLYSKSMGRNHGRASVARGHGLKALFGGSVSKGFVPKGTSFWNANEMRMEVCTYQFETRPGWSHGRQGHFCDSRQRWNGRRRRRRRRFVRRQVNTLDVCMFRIIS